MSEKKRPKALTLHEMAKELDFTCDWCYIQYIYDSMVNGQRAQAIRLYEAIPSNEIETFRIALFELVNNPDEIVKLGKYLGFDKTKIENLFFDNGVAIPQFEM